jgi:hypothetical protein
MALQCVMRAHEALFWEQEQDGTMVIYKPKRPRPRNGGETYDRRELDQRKLESIEARQISAEALQDYEALEALRDSPAHSTRTTRGKPPLFQ